MPAVSNSLTVMPTLEYNKEEGTVTISNLEGTFTCGSATNRIEITPELNIINYE